MATITRTLMASEVKYGLLFISGLQACLPACGAPVTLIDTEGQRYAKRMHTRAPRIDGLTDLHRKYQSQVGHTVRIDVDPSDTTLAYVHFHEQLIDAREPSALPVDQAPESETFFITASLESLLEDFIVNNLSALEAGLRLFHDDDGIPGRQYPTEVGTIDLLCLDRTHNLVVVELKRGRESDRVIGQISRYMGWVKAHIAGASRSVRGLVVLHQPTDKYPEDKKLVYAVLANPQIALRYYAISLRFLAQEQVALAQVQREQYQRPLADPKAS